jgi:hypothetical protein
MPVIATDTQGLSNLVKRAHPWMDSEGYGIEVATTTAALGQVMVKVGAVWSAITALPLVTDNLGVCLDATSEDSTKKRILAKGEAVVGSAALIYFAGATAPNRVAVNGFLENNKNIQVSNQI